MPVLNNNNINNNSLKPLREWKALPELTRRAERNGSSPVYIKIKELSNNDS